MAEHKFGSNSQQPKIEQSKVEQPRIVEVTVKRVEVDAAIVKVEGWSMRVYFDKSLSAMDKDRVRDGSLIKVEYLGDISDVHSLKLLPLKSV